jgi:hypothetical protein
MHRTTERSKTSSMRPLVSTLLMAWLVVLPTTSTRADSSLALRGEGYIGYSNLEFGAFDDDAFQGGGTGSVSIVEDGLYLQADVFGDAADYGLLDSKNVGAGAHVGLRDAERGRVGLAGAYNRLDELEADFWRAGFEGEIFLDRFTLALNAGYLDQDGDSTGHADAGLAFYPTDRARVQVGGGLYDIEESDPIGTISASGELLVMDALGTFVRWESLIQDGPFDIEQHSIVFGVAVYWGAADVSLLAYDRLHFKRSCSGHLVFGGRIC